MSLTLRQRRSLISLAAWAVATAVFFWAVPPLDRQSAALAGLLSLMVLPLIRWSDRRRAVISLSLSLVLSVVAILTYQSLFATRTVRHGDQVHYVGTELTPVAQSYVEDHPEEPLHKVLESAAWDETFVWTEVSLRNTRLLLLASYVFCVPFLAASLLAAIQLGTSYVHSPVAAAAAARRRSEPDGKAAAQDPDGLIFFSYSRRDTEFCLQLAQDLKEKGLDAWIDQLDIPAGTQWDSAVEEALRRAATVLIVLSPDSVESQNVLDEVGLAIDGKALVVPILYRACELPLRLRRLQYVDFSGDYEEAFEQLASKLAASRGTAKPPIAD